MGFALLWIELLAAALAWTALTAALSAHRATRARAVTTAVLATCVPLLAGTAAAVGSAVLEMCLVYSPWFPYAAAWTGVYAVAAAAIVTRAMRRPESCARLRGTTWSRGRWGIATATALALSCLTFADLDAAVRGRLVALRAEATALALSAAPVRPSERDNAAHLYLQAFDAMRGAHDDAWRADLSRPDLDPADPELKAMLAQREVALALLRRAAALPACSFERDYARPSADMLLPELADLRAATALLGLSARRYAAEGRGRDAVADVRAMLGISDHFLADGPLLISCLCAISARHRAVGVLSAVLATTEVPAAELATLDVDGRCSFRLAMMRSLRMEEAFGLWTFASVTESPAAASVLGGEIPALASPLLPGWRVFFLEQDIAGYRRALRHCQELASWRYPRAREGWAAVDQNPFQWRGGIVTALLVPALGHACRRAAEADALMMACGVGIAAERFHAEHGAYPERIEDLVPSYLPGVPRDPFIDDALRWRATTDGAFCYSVGANGTDDGGVDEHQKWDGCDVVFRLGAEFTGMK